MLAVACVAQELVDQLWRAMVCCAMELHFCSSTKNVDTYKLGKQLVSAASSMCSTPQQAPNMCTKADLHTKRKQKPDIDKKESRSSTIKRGLCKTRKEIQALVSVLQMLLPNCSVILQAKLSRSDLLLSRKCTPVDINLFGVYKISIEDLILH